MADFDVQKAIKKYSLSNNSKGFDVAASIEQYVKPKNQGGFDIGSSIKKYTPVGLSTTNPEIKKLQGIASKNNIDTSAIFAQKGESPKQIFSGGVITDIFDVMNALQYGVTGILKGKSFSEGVRTRQSFSDKDALGAHGIPGTIAGVALDIAVDPLTYVPVFGIGKAALKGLQGTGHLAGSIIGKVPVAKQVGEQLGRMFIYRFGQDAVYKELAERSTRNLAVGIENVLELARPISKLDGATQRVIAEARKAGTLNSLPADLLQVARPAFDELDRLGQEAVKLGLLSKETYEANVGKYLARLYRTKEAPEGVAKKLLKGNKPLRIDLSRFKARKDIPEDVREAMGEILEAGYPTAKSLVQLSQAVERAGFFAEVAKKWGADIAGEGLERLPEVKTLGALSGKYVPRAIFDDIQELTRVQTKTQRNIGKVVAGFKFGKVILNPSTHIRNIMSNFVLNNFEGLSPARVDIYARAAHEVATGGKLWKEAKSVGLGLDTFAANELKAMLQGPEAANWLARAGRATANKLSQAYQNEEMFAKMAQFIYQRGKGLSPEDAAKIAERATFNYAQVTPFIRRMRESIFGFPFITFTYKVTPQVARTAITKPTKISNIGKIKQAIENMSDLSELSAERASEPSYVRDGFYIKLPMKDKHGRSAYFDLTYILPFGDLLSGNFFERGIKRETGLPEAPGEALLRKSPFFALVKELGSNQDFFGNKIWKESDSSTQQLGDLMRHLVKTYSPPLVADQIPGGYRKDGSQRPGTVQRIVGQSQQGIESGGFQGRTLAQELFRQVGLKVSPVDLELQQSFMEQEQQQALETLLLEAGILRQFERTYEPKKR